MKKYMACNFQLHGFCKKKTWRNSYGEFGISLINQTSGKKKRNSQVDPLPPKGSTAAKCCCQHGSAVFFLASGIWSTQTSFLSYRRLYGLLARERTTHNGSLPKSGGGIQRPKGGSLSFSIGTGAWQLASRSVGYEKKICGKISFRQTKDKWQEEKKDNIDLGELQFNHVANVSRRWSSLWYHSCDYARKLTSATRISPRKKERQWTV